MYGSFMTYDSYGSKQRQQQESLEDEREASMAAVKIKVILAIIHCEGTKEVNKTLEETAILVTSQGGHVTQEHKAVRKNFSAVWLHKT